MVTRRDIIGGIAGILAAQSAPAMLIGARTVAMMAQQGKTYKAKDYVQDGLIAMWDGIENAGWGVHDENATVWKDLIGGISPTIKGTVGDDYVNSVGQMIVGSYLNRYFGVGTSFSVECVYDRGDTTIIYCGPFYVGYQLVNIYKNEHYEACVGDQRGTGQIYRYSTSRTHSAYSRDAETRTVIAYIDGSEVINRKSSVFDASVQGNSSTFLGASLHTGSVLVNCVRIYSRSLTQSEIAANYAVDKARFGLT